MKSPLLILLCLLVAYGHAQKPIDPDRMKTFNIVVNYDTYTVKTQMLKDAKKIKVLDDRSYLWCSANKIIETKAGYDGKLLHGYYKSFYFENNQLRESGFIKYGLRNKEWRYWYADGKLKEIITYKKGRKHGKYQLYNDYGNLMAKGKFRNDLLQGKFYTYNNTGAIAETKRYRHGVEIIPKPKKEKVRKVKEPKPKKEKKVKKAPDEEPQPAKEPKKRKKEKTPASEQPNDQPAPAKQKKSLGQKLKNLFKKKEKAPATPENKPVSSSV